MHNFASSNEDFPRLGVPPGGVGEFRAWPVELLPFLDYASLYERMAADPAFPAEDIAIEVLTCPDDFSASDVNNGLSYVVNAGYGGSVSSTATPTFLKNNFLATLTWSNWYLSTSAEGGRESGIFWVDADVDPEEITRGDGTSNTLLMSESIYAESWSEVIFRQNPPNTIPQLQSNFEMMKVCFLIGDDGLLLEGESSFAHRPPSTSLRILDTDLEHYRINYGITNNGREGTLPAPNSLHPGGVNGAFADGHIEFLNQNMDEGVYARMLTWAGGRNNQLVGNASSSGPNRPPTGGP